MSAMAALVLQYGFLVLLWIFVYLAARTVVTDLYGAKGRGGRGSRGGRAAAPAATSAAPPAQPVARELVVTRGALAGTRVALAKAPITMGRGAGCTLVLDDEYASTKHAKLYTREGQWVIEDLGSTNGTFVSRTRVTAPTPVPLGASIQVGQTFLELRA